MVEPMPLRRVLTALFLLSTFAGTASAQITPAAGYTPPDDTPSFRVGVTLYTDYTYQQSPTTTDSDGNTINPGGFNVTRSYINVTGNLNHIISYRITPDITRESGILTTGTGTSISNDSLIFRIKYAFGQVNLDDWMPRGTWVRLGIQQTPLLDYEEGIYRYRFQGTTFTEREGFYNSADAGVSFHTNFPKNYGEIHAGLYNGDGYAKAELNDRHAFDIRGTLRPFAQAAPVLRGLRVTGYYVADDYVENAPRTRAVGQVTFEHKYLNAGFDVIDAHDQTSITKANVEAKGWSFWATPRAPQANGSSFEVLLRYDHLVPNEAAVDQTRQRTIAGAAYWFKTAGSIQSALLLDYDGQTFSNFVPTQPAQKKIALHALINF
jgi:hypothetical protein